MYTCVIYVYMREFVYVCVCARVCRMYYTTFNLKKDYESEKKDKLKKYI